MCGIWEFVPDSRNAHSCGTSESGEWEGSGAGAAGVQVDCSIIRRHCRSLTTTPRSLVLPHAVSSLSILRDRGDGGDSQEGIQTMPPSTSATLTVVLTTHPSDGLVKDDHGERHGVATAPPRAHRTRLRRDRKVLNLFACSTYVREWYAASFPNSGEEEMETMLASIVGQNRYDV